MVWAVVVWKLWHGTFVALRTADETMAPAGCQLVTGQTVEQAAERINQRQVGVQIRGWREAPARDGVRLMLATVTEAPIELTPEMHWIDVDQLPLLTAVIRNHDLMIVWHALQGI